VKEYVPEEHATHPEAEEAPETEYLPAAQAEHCLFDVDVQVSETYLPGPQVEQGSQVDDCPEDWKVPLTQAFITPPMQ